MDDYYDDDAEEVTSITFNDPGPLGFVLEQDYDGPITIDTISPEASLEALELLQSGMVLTHVQDKCVMGYSFEDVLDIIRAAGRPLDLKFSGE